MGVTSGSTSKAAVTAGALATRPTRSARRQIRMLAGALMASALIGGCSGPPGAGLLRGDDLGGFRVEAVQLANDCGEGSLGEQDAFEFEVDLSALSTELFWDGRASAPLVNDHFEVRSSLRFTMREGFAPGLGCEVERVDVISGLLQRSGSRVPRFSGDMSYSFAEGSDSSCTPEDAQQADVERLPCSLSYSLEGVRIRDPSPAE